MDSTKEGMPTLSLKVIHPSIYRTHSMLQWWFTHSFIHKDENPTTACSFIDSGACYELVEWCKEEEELSDGHRPVVALVLRPFRPLAVTAVCWPQLQAVALVAIAQLHAFLTGSHESMWMDLPRSSLALDWMESISLNLIASLNHYWIDVITYSSSSSSWWCKCWCFS